MAPAPMPSWSTANWRSPFPRSQERSLRLAYPSSIHVWYERGSSHFPKTEDSLTIRLTLPASRPGAHKTDFMALAVAVAAALIVGVARCFPLQAPGCGCCSPFKCGGGFHRPACWARGPSAWQHGRGFLAQDAAFFLWVGLFRQLAWGGCLFWRAGSASSPLPSASPSESLRPFPWP